MSRGELPARFRARASAGKKKDPGFLARDAERPVKNEEGAGMTRWEGEPTASGFLAAPGVLAAEADRVDQGGLLRRGGAKADFALD
jgi:hypothetical protein